ncbi:MAG: hypothetical protein EXR62_03230 [Chloroflexi bacterium]|nr:hypothetical protein [Chloroflexota bacterium]
MHNGVPLVEINQVETGAAGAEVRWTPVAIQPVAAAQGSVLEIGIRLQFFGHVDSGDIFNTRLVFSDNLKNREGNSKPAISLLCTRFPTAGVSA